jgi:hypothetical protein
MFYSSDCDQGGAAVPHQPVNALLYRLAFSLLRLVIEHRKETRREAKPIPALRSVHLARPAQARRAEVEPLRSHISWLLTVIVGALMR